MIFFDIDKTLGTNKFTFQATLIRPVTTVVGKSGAGKSTLALLISGLSSPDKGRIQVEGRIFFDSEKGINLPCEKRGIGMVFQNPRLFLHFTAEENMRFPLSHCNRKSIVKFDELVDLLDLGSLLKRKLGELSGGEAQRVSLGRAILASELLLILDEPLSSLDIVRKKELLEYIGRIPCVLRIPILYITHSPNEAKKVGNESLFIDAGQIEAIGSPEEIFQKLQNLGDQNEI